MDKGTVVIGGISQESLCQAESLSRQMFENQKPVVLADYYHDTNVSVKVVKIIQSYTGIINRVI